ncbi:diheme cytochrome c [Burkholderia glumae]|uniref:Diheme cytochrome c n=1 Tax=Burkholderia glumae TaxID=337 RepID=A0AAQ0BRX5_BURGL|nr:diheme cytochrome c [Burkholderia glumae]ACR31473.1 Dihem cytochrome c [Burkholderia glumae BGR1]AJY62844.1 DHC, diheme cytochrome c domain protein [Burkholderia glumae LMG 2196 = ATCC 33617]KHJ61254.1 cytochrome C [Burkholderia glumae]MCM2485368.1 diheme cytochrome c [Burkholderia glumae]MCM2495773.1 diheme cytochrome c [Burkholderia glumae]
MRIRLATVITASTTLAAAMLSAPGFADEQRLQARAVAPLPTYQQECAACHLAYPPAMLPADSWRRILGKLDHHFGTNASLDPASVKQLDSWLTTHAAQAERTTNAPPEDRITRSRWFMAAHDEIPASTWRRPAIKSASNCAACHTRADQGNFDERYLRIPR